MAQPAILNAFLDDAGAEIIVYERTDKGVRARRVPAEYVTFHRREDLSDDMIRELKSLPILSSMRFEGDWIRLGWTGDMARSDARYGMRKNDIETYEGDVDPVTLWLVESRVTIDKPRRCYLDIETDSRVPLARKEDMRVLVWACTDHDTGEVTTDVLTEDTDEAERVHLSKLAVHLAKYDQISTYEGDWKGGEFDAFVVPVRMQRAGVHFDARRWLWVNQLAVWRKMNMQTAETGAEKESFKLEDICHEQLGEGKEKAPPFVIERFGSKQSLGALSWWLWDAGGEFRDLLERYCGRDSALLRKLELKKGFLTIFQAVCEVCGIIPVTKSLQPTRQMDGFLLRLGRAHNHRFATKVFREEKPSEEDLGQFKGAVVFRPKSVAGDEKGEHKWSADEARAWRAKHGFKNGILRDVHVCDFASLYPSIMRTYNLSADVRAGWMTKAEFKKGGAPEGKIWSPGTNLLTESGRVGIIPLALSELIRLRKEWSDLAASLPPGTPEWADAQAKSNAYKVTANSFYGGGGSSFSRFNDRDVSEATTQNSVHYLRLCADEAEKRGMVLVYGDTDSNFVIGPSEDGFRSFVGWLNSKRFPKEVTSHGCKENHVKLAFEKTFSRIVFVAAKAYVGRYSQYKGTRAREDSKPEIKGVAYKRGDKGKLARELQGKIIDCLVGGMREKNEHGVEVPVNPGIVTPTEDIEIYHAIISKARDHILSDPLPVEDVRFSKGISKPLREYGKPGAAGLPGHVQIAYALKDRGQAIGQGSRIEYVVVDGEASPQRMIAADDYAGECDRFFLWERVYQPSKLLLDAAFPDHDWNSWADVRPKKPRGKAGKVPEEQLGFRLGGGVKNAPEIADDDDLAMTTYVAAPLIIRVPEAAGEDGLKRLEAVMRAHPGARAVEIVICTSQGEAVIKPKLRVMPGPTFRSDVEEAVRVDVAS